jgi:hypothetical protein
MCWIAVMPTQANRRLEWATHQLFITLGEPKSERENCKQETGDKSLTSM